MGWGSKAATDDSVSRQALAGLGVRELGLLQLNTRPPATMSVQTGSRPGCSNSLELDTLAELGYLPSFLPGHMFTDQGPMVIVHGARAALRWVVYQSGK